MAIPFDPYGAAFVDEGFEARVSTCEDYKKNQQNLKRLC